MSEPEVIWNFGNPVCRAKEHPYSIRSKTDKELASELAALRVDFGYTAMCVITDKREPIKEMFKKDLDENKKKQLRIQNEILRRKLGVQKVKIIEASKSVDSQPRGITA